MALWMSVIPPIPLYALSLAVEGPSAGFESIATVGTHTGLVALGGLAYIVVLGTIGGAGLWAYLMTRHPASKVAPFSLLVPIVGISAAWAILGETPTVWELVGGAVVIIGCFAGVTGAKSKPAKEKNVEPSSTDEPMTVP
jgi:O-acetylserine/cysteine efflux transporter